MNILYISGTYCSTLADLKNVCNKTQLESPELSDEMLCAYKDGALLSWIENLPQNSCDNYEHMVHAINAIDRTQNDAILFMHLLRALDIDIAENKRFSFSDYIVIDPSVKVGANNGKIEVFNRNHPIHLSEFSENVTIELSIEVLKKINGEISISLSDSQKTINLMSGQKHIDVQFDVIIKDTPNYTLPFRIEGVPTFDLQIITYPEKEWDEEKLLSEGITMLYSQDYTKAQACFRAITSSEIGEFWLAVMDYIGCLSFKPKLVSAAAEFERLQMDSAKVLWSIMSLKGEGCLRKIENAKTLVENTSPETPGKDALLRLIEDKASLDDYKILYAYSPRNTNKPITVPFEIIGNALEPSYITSLDLPFVIRYGTNIGNSALKKISKTSTIYAHIGVTTNYGKWQYATDWDTNDERFAMKFNPLSKKWELRVENLRSLLNIPYYEYIRRINIVFRTADKAHVGKDNENEDFCIECYISPQIKSLINLSPLLPQSIIK